MDSSDFNNFVISFGDRFAERATGADGDSATLPYARPADRILAGYLTAPLEERAGEDAELTDLPKDSAYEQTAIGVDWLCSLSTVRPDDEIAVSAEASVYIKLLPSYADAVARAVWQRPRRNGVDASPEKLTEVAPVWQRVKLPPFQWSISIPNLLNHRQQSHDLSPVMDTWWVEEGARTPNRYPGREPLPLTERDLQSPADFERWRSELTHPKTDSCPWKADLVAMVTPSGDSIDQVRISVRFRNRSPEVSRRSLDYVDANLYCAQLTCRFGSHHHRPMHLNELRDSFRYDRRLWAVGLNSHAVTTVDGNTSTVRTESIPRERTFRLVPRSIPSATPRFDTLAADGRQVLHAIHSAMVQYDDSVWKRKISGLTGGELHEAELARRRYLQEVNAFERGVRLLEDDRYPQASTAFRLMNLAMSRSAAKYHEWRLFQIIFIVSQLPSLLARYHPELHVEDHDVVEILWFAAGGGKTEAFLGLILFQCFLDRLEGKHWGVTAILRFPLRLLTFQQMQRVARALAQAELVRREKKIPGKTFSIGYFVGQSVTPNRIKPEDREQWLSTGPPQKYQRLFKCPFCDSAVQLHYASDIGELQHLCTNRRCTGGGGPLPLYIVDDDIYRFLPTLLISTVDKLAIIGQNQRFANLLGRITGFCDTHGADFHGTNGDLCPSAPQTSKSRQKNRPPCAHYQPGPFPNVAPALLIQDELHLLSEELGTFDSHYETAVMQLARSFGQQPWKIVTATATIEAFARHGWSLYLKQARQFPGPGPSAYDSFYYQADWNRLARVFIGVVGVGRKHTPSVTRTLSLIYQELQHARTVALTDIAAANRRYGTRDLSSDEFRDLIFMYECPLTYVLTRKGSDQVSEAIETRVKSELREVAPETGELIVDTFNGGVEIAEMIATLEQITEATPDSDPSSRIRGIVTTNIIGHGVDIDRFNVIVFAGFTRLVAEYIQAGARVGRTYPGIVLFVATPQSERDRSIYSRFGKFHEYVDRLVDPSALSRWTEPAMRRTAPGILAAYLMGVAAQSVGRRLAFVEDVQDVFGTSNALTSDTIGDWMQRAYGTEHAPDRFRKQLEIMSANLFASVINSVRGSGGQKKLLSQHLDAMTSLRDVDEPADIAVLGEADKRSLRRIAHV